MINSREWESHLKDPEDKFRAALGLKFSGNLSDCPKRLQELLKILSKEKETYGGSAALTAFEDELHQRGIPRTFKNLDLHLFDPELNPDTLAQRNPNGEDQAANPRLSCTLKVKVYMGDGWEVDFKNWVPFRAPDLYVKVGINKQDGINKQVDIVRGDESMKRTKTKKKNWKPTWGEEEFSFNLIDPEAAILSIQVYDESVVTSDKFAGQTKLQVSLLRPGIRYVPLLFKDGKKCSATWLLMRFLCD